MARVGPNRLGRTGPVQATKHGSASIPIWNLAETLPNPSRFEGEGGGVGGGPMASNRRRRRLRARALAARRAEEALLAALAQEAAALAQEAAAPGGRGRGRGRGRERGHGRGRGLGRGANPLAGLQEGPPAEGHGAGHGRGLGRGANPIAGLQEGPPAEGHGAGRGRGLGRGANPLAALHEGPPAEGHGAGRGRGRGRGLEPMAVLPEEAPIQVHGRGRGRGGVVPPIPVLPLAVLEAQRAGLDRGFVVLNGMNVFVFPNGWTVLGGAARAPPYVPGMDDVQQPPPDDDEAESSAPKKTGRKNKKWRMSYDNFSDYEDLTPHGNEELLAALKECKYYEGLVPATREQNTMPPQTSRAEIEEIICDADLAPDHLDDYCTRKHQWHIDHFPRKIVVRLPDGKLTVVAITPNKETSIENRTHHIVSLLRSIDGIKAMVLVENYSLYAVAFKVLFHDEDEMTVPWFLFGEDDLWKDRLGHFVRIKYGPSYTNNVQRVFIDEATGNNIIDFMLSFRKTPQNPEGNYDQDATEDGHLMLETVIVFACEAPRFELIRYWAVHQRSHVGKDLCDVMQDWLSVSKCVHLLVLHLEEAKLAEFAGGLMSKICEASKESAISWWETRQEFLSHPEMIFFTKLPEPAKRNVPMLNQLAGSHLKLLRNDEEVWDQIIMRQLGYAGYWMNKIGCLPPDVTEAAADNDDDGSLDIEDDI